MGKERLFYSAFSSAKTVYPKESDLIMISLKQPIEEAKRNWWLNSVAIWQLSSFK